MQKPAGTSAAAGMNSSTVILKHSAPWRLLVQLLDSRHAPSADDVQMMEYLHYHSIPFLAALTKADKLKAAQKQQAVQDFQQFCLPYGADGSSSPVHRTALVWKSCAAG